MNWSILIPKAGWSVWDALRSLEDAGRRRGRAAGGYIAGDLSELQKTIFLCPACKHGFDWKKHRYYSIPHYDNVLARGRCDVCHQHSASLWVYLHEAHGSAGWARRDQLREPGTIVS